MLEKLVAYVAGPRLFRENVMHLVIVHSDQMSLWGNFQPGELSLLARLRVRSIVRRMRSTQVWQVVALGAR